MAIEVTRHFDYAVRWSVNLETEMVSIQRLLAYTHIKQERTGIVQDSQTNIFIMRKVETKPSRNYQELGGT